MRLTRQSVCLPFIVGTILCSIAQSARPSAFEASPNRGPNGPPPLETYQQDLQTRFYWFLLEGQEYYDDPIGGPGLDPSRSYYVAFDGSPICVQIRDALNRALGHPAEAQRSVMRPLPDSVMHASYPRDPTAKTYESKNPVYADGMFLSWNYIDQAPGSLDLDKLSGPGRRWNDQDFARWLVAPVLNDGVPRLVLRFASGAFIWQISASALHDRNWSDWRSWQPLQYAKEGCPEGQKGPLEKALWVCAHIDSPDGLIHNGFPKLSSSELVKEPWYGANRPVSTIDFAAISGHLYEVLHTLNRDIIIVTDPRLKPGEDLCYLTSRLLTS